MFVVVERLHLLLMHKNKTFKSKVIRRKLSQEMDRTFCFCLFFFLSMCLTSDSFFPIPIPSLGKGGGRGGGGGCCSSCCGGRSVRIFQPMIIRKTRILLVPATTTTTTTTTVATI